MNRYLLMLTLFIFSFIVSVKAQFKIGSKANVWMLDGIKLYSRPTGASNIVLTIPYGKQVTIIDHANAYTRMITATTNKYGNLPRKSYTLGGFWSKIHFNGQQGYVFDGYLSMLPCLKISKIGCEEMSDYLERNYGKPKITSDKHSQRKTFQYTNGNTLINSNFEGCFAEDVLIRNITYRDIVLFVNVYTYGADAIDELTIKKADANAYRINLGSCD